MPHNVKSTKSVKSESLFDIHRLEDAIGYTFKDKQLPYLAFSHSSYVNEKKSNSVGSYERLEFLGDAVVNMIVSEYLYEKYPSLTEGELTRIRAIVVCESTFSKCIKNIKLGEFLLLGKGEELSGGRDRVSILADLLEAVTAAIFLDGGIQAAKRFALNQLEGIISDAIKGVVFMDYKTQLQEVLQKNGDSKIAYSILNESGPDHDKEFIVEVKNNNKSLGTGKGKSKKEAEQYAAKEALSKLV